MDNLQELIDLREGLKTRLQAVQREVIAEVGALDQRVYWARLAENGLQAEWDELQAHIDKLTPKRPTRSPSYRGYIRHEED